MHIVRRQNELELIEFKLGDILELKKEHPCATRSTRWEVVRMGADVKIKCLGCQTIVMIDRYDINKRIKRVIETKGDAHG